MGRSVWMSPTGGTPLRTRGRIRADGGGDPAAERGPAHAAPYRV